MLGAGERMARGDFDAAFALADRRCRLIVPSARDLYLRAQTHKAAGRLDAAQRDLSAALALDPTDAAIDRAALHWGSAEARAEAAARIMARPSSDWGLRRKAAAALFEAGAALGHRLEHTQYGVSGWIVWVGEAALRIEMSHAGGREAFLLDPDPDHPLAAAGICAANIEIEAPEVERLTLELTGPDGAFERVAPARAARPRPRPPAPRNTAAASQTPFVTIVVPVYEDFDATRACLEALSAARPKFGYRILVVDDASPNADLADYLDEQAARGAFELIRNEANLGFAASVNKALARRERGDALLLNADAVLPPGAIDRLRDLSRSSPDIGAVTPFSNNGELTSYPRRNEANPMPASADIAALDARARAANGDALVDIPNGIGFCLYVTEACLDAVGGLPELYAQGYYEDVEFCLTAREQGFRNVAAPGVYVGHAGSRSFGPRKRALVMRNLQLIEARFPGYRLETAAFVALDPLQPYRAALDAACPPPGPVTLIAGGPGAAAAWGERRARALQAQTPERAVMTASARGRVLAVAAVGEGAPQSLSFDFATAAGAEGFRDYLDRLDVRRIELLDPAALPDEALAQLIAREAEIDLLCGDFGWFSTAAPPPRGSCRSLDSHEPCDSCRAQTAARQEEGREHSLRRFKLGRALERAGRVIPLDRLAESFAQRVFKSRAAAFEGARAAATSRAGPIARLGVLYPHRKPETDRLLLRLGRRLAGSGAESDIVVFGATLDDNAAMATGRIFVTGRASPEDYVALGEHFRVDGWLAPDRGGGYGDLEASAIGAPKAYFDWSFGAFAVEWGDLSLDPRICEDKAAARIARWINGEQAGAG